MRFAGKRASPPRDRGVLVSARTICLLVAATATAAGCASPLFRTHSDLPLRKSAIRTMGLSPPAIAMYEEQYRFKLIPHGEWSPAATEAVREAFLEEMNAGGRPVVAIDGNDRELIEMAELFGAVDFSIGRHVYEDRWKETFPEKVRSFDYSLGPSAEAMARYRVDAIWFVSGTNLLPTAGTRVADSVEVLLAVAGAMGGAPTFVSNLMKLELRAALVDRSGTVLFYCILTQPDVWRAEQDLDRVDDLAAGGAPDAGTQRESLRDDIRDPTIARRWVRALLSEYRKATE